ncbi:MAG: chemotaxis response regulator protein-glutamate methylesterase [Cyanobacteria bacterium J06623_4]
MRRSIRRSIKVAIANDTLIALSALRRVIATDPTYDLIWTAKNGQEAVALCQQLPPDLVLMDLLMPGIDGVEATRQIMARSPCAILIVTASLTQNMSKVFEAMGHGALDVVGTPTFGPLGRDVVTVSAAAPLLEKMATVSTLVGKSARRGVVRPFTHPADSHQLTLPPLIVMGASTGGPKALAKVLGGLSDELPAGIVVVQHIDKQFAEGFASWLNEQTALSVAVATSGDRIQPGKVLVAATNEHLVMQRERTLAYKAVEAPTPYRPSVDVFFSSVAQHWPRAGQAVLMTGMGRDGAAGMEILQTAGWHTIAESEASCVVYGMPRAAVEMGAARKILPVGAIASALVSGTRPRHSRLHRPDSGPRVEPRAK